MELYTSVVLSSMHIHTLISGVGTVAAVAAMAATLFCGSFFFFFSNDCHVVSTAHVTMHHVCTRVYLIDVYTCKSIHFCDRTGTSFD